MGNRLVIKNADFSTNAVYNDDIEWLETGLLKGFIVSNPASSVFGEISTVTTTDNYKKLARLSSTIEVPNGKKITIRIYNVAEVLKYIYITSVGYKESWSGSTIPEEALPATSLYYASAEYYPRYEWVNNTGETVYFQACVGIEGITNLSTSNYIVRYYIS